MCLVFHTAFSSVVNKVVSLSVRCACIATRVAGFGPDWQQAHVLGREQVAVPPEMRALVMPGITSWLASLRVSHPDHAMLPTLEALDWLVEIWCQDLPFKLVRYRSAWARLFPREVAAATRHPRWLEFANQVLASDAASKTAAAANRDWKGNPVQVHVWCTGAQILCGGNLTNCTC